MYICSGIDIQYIIKYKHIRRILLDQDYMPLHALFLTTYTQGPSQVEYENVFHYFKSQASFESTSNALSYQWLL